MCPRCSWCSLRCYFCVVCHSYRAHISPWLRQNTTTTSAHSSESPSAQPTTTVPAQLAQLTSNVDPFEPTDGLAKSLDEEFAQMVATMGKEVCTLVCTPVANFLFFSLLFALKLFCWDCCTLRRVLKSKQAFSGKALAKQPLVLQVLLTLTTVIYRSTSHVPPCPLLRSFSWAAHCTPFCVRRRSKTFGTGVC